VDLPRQFRELAARLRRIAEHPENPSVHTAMRHAAARGCYLLSFGAENCSIGLPEGFLEWMAENPHCSIGTVSDENLLRRRANEWVVFCSVFLEIPNPLVLCNLGSPRDGISILEIQPQDFYIRA